jgi:hypothetical protein
LGGQECGKVGRWGLDYMVSEGGLWGGGPGGGGGEGGGGSSGGASVNRTNGAIRGKPNGIGAACYIGRGGWWAGLKF